MYLCVSSWIPLFLPASVACIVATIGIPKEFAICVSAKTGENIKDILEAVVEHVRPPKGSINNPLKDVPPMDVDKCNELQELFMKKWKNS